MQKEGKNPQIPRFPHLRLGGEENSPKMKKHTSKPLKNQDLEVCKIGDPYGTRTHDTTVKGWCLNRLTNGPYIKTA